VAGRGVAVAPVGERGRILSIARILLIVGGVLFLSGHTLFIASFFQGAQDEVATIPPGPLWFVEYEIRVLGASRVSGHFADADGGLVNVYVFGETQYKVFAFIGLGDGLYSIEARSGSFSADLPASGTYHLVFAHGDGSEQVAQPVWVSYWVAGIEPALVGVGTAFIAAGIVGVSVGLWRRERSPRCVTPDM